MEELDDKVSDRRYELLFPRTLSMPIRIVIWLHGYLDARRGLVQLSREGYLTSPYCKSLVDEADYRLNAEWQECNGIMFELKPKLTAAMRERAELRRMLEQLPAVRERVLAEAKAERAGDAFVSEHLAKKRAIRRIALVDDHFDQEEERLRAVLNDSESRVDALLTEYQDCRDVADTHERVVRVDFLARLSVYARGASRRLNIGASYINDKALSNAPREGNDRFFADCLDGELSSESLFGSVE